MDNSTFFLYSKFSAWLNCSIAFAGLCFIIYLPTCFPDPAPLNVKLFLYILALLPAYGLFFTIKKNLLPALQGYAALELDEEKLTYYLNGRVIYWRDVEDVCMEYWHSAYLSFKVRNERMRITVGLKWVAGNNNDIIEQVQGYIDEYSKK